jgi:hypothetical protein
MSENQQPNHDPLEEATLAFQRMTVPERPADAEVLARLGSLNGDLAQPSRIPSRSNRRPLARLLVASTAAAVLLLGGLALFLQPSAPPESVRVAGTASSGASGGGAVPHPPTSAVAVPLPPTSKESLMEGVGERVLRERSLEQRVADAQVIVVATALDSTPAPPMRPGDFPEALIRFRVTRVLKGNLAEEIIATRTPTAPDEFIGKEWVVFLSPEYMAGKHQFAECHWIKAEPEVKAILSKDTK